MDKDMCPMTECIHGPSPYREDRFRSLIPPIYPSTTYFFENAQQGAKLFKEQEKGYIYTRLGNPTISILEKKISFLERGEDSAAFASGMAAISACVFSCVSPGEEIIYSEPIYGGTYHLFQILKNRYKIKIKGIPSKNFPEKIKKALTEKTKLVYIETPANPTMDIIDIEEVAKITKDIPLFVDNTFATPYIQKPLTLGASLVIHSLTKYLTGHGDAIGGIIVGKKEIVQRAREEYMVNFGGIISPFNAWLAIRGIKTLAIRMKAHSENAIRVAKFLEEHPLVQKVFYPGLPSFEGHRIAKKQMKNGFSGMLSFIHKNGKNGALRFLNSLKLCTLAVSLGCVETLVEHPASMTHSTYPEEYLKKIGIDPGLIRISIGLEDPEDIINDIYQALRDE